MKQIIKEWFEKLNETEKIPTNIIAINFGLFESDKNYIIYLVGSETYDENDDDWATEVNYEPQNKYLKLIDIQKMNWKEVQNETGKIIAELIYVENFEDSIFSKIKNITVGFDDGDLIKIK
ncbi:hypothetical protein KB553_09140 [Chryseobacterium rhizoplanae]|uniref:hypothetical protein n=1 Tax=Chryseobacterium rhizoplanae TaxID=1609531 RepID=UPI001CE2A665|nr:hypothetical protein [Chryseobacterium rhizoplanae]UCA61686.1 hypothetical protein KB553_09140 [Chryseobacterium rhizoplanae]